LNVKIEETREIYFREHVMKRRAILLLTVYYSLLFAFLPDLVPGRFAYPVDEAGWYHIDYPGSTSFPEEFLQLQDTRQRKRQLIDTLLPLVLKANEDILAQRRELKRMEKVPSLTAHDRKLIEDLASVYRVKHEDHRAMLEELLVKVDVLPASLVLAQAAIESGWGTSRFATEGNNVFGLRGPKGSGMTPGALAAGCSFSLSTFSDLQECINFYLWNINTRSEYESLRKIRTQAHVNYDPVELARGLESYSEIGNAYVDKVVGLIRDNNLTEYDLYRLKPVKEQRAALLTERILGSDSTS